MSAGVKASVLVFIVLLVHSLPEGFAIGTAYASDTVGLSPIRDRGDRGPGYPRGNQRRDPDGRAGFSRSRQFWAAVGTSAPQPIGAAVAHLLVEEIEPLLPFSFGFAAGAMLALVVVELLPDALRGDPRGAALGALLGATRIAPASAPRWGSEDGP